MFVLPATVGPWPANSESSIPAQFIRSVSSSDPREDIFLHDVERHDFLKTLAEACQKTGWRDPVQLDWIPNEKLKICGQIYGPTPSTAADCVIEDFDGDGKPDIAAIGASTGNLKLYQNSGR